MWSLDALFNYHPLIGGVMELIFYLLQILSIQRGVFLGPEKKCRHEAPLILPCKTDTIVYE